jgi:hypothetical protein
VIRRVLLLALLWGGAARAQVPVTVRFDDPGRGTGPSLLQNALTSPYRVIPPGTTSVLLRRDSSYQHSVVILGRTAAVDGTVKGDVIVVGGDLFLHPGADISGRAIAIGGGVYESTLGHVAGETRAFRNFTYDIRPIPGGFALRYRSWVDVSVPILSWPGLFGIRLIGYDRTDGVSFPFAPLITLPHVSFEPRATYRSQLGVVDPSLAAQVLAADQTTTIRVNVGRGTFTNEKWIWHDLVNSAATLIGGDDARNYYRATRAQTTVGRRWDTGSSAVEPYLGVRWESDRSVRPDSFATGGPWSFFGRHDVHDMLRPNPRIDEGDITSLVTGASLEWTGDDMAARLRLDAELGQLSPVSSAGDTVASGFAQTTWDGTVSFRTFRTQQLRIDAHALITLSSSAPRQRWAYVGGAGSLPTIDMLSRGGDQLLAISASYAIPIEGVQVPLVGPPTVSLREILAGADVGRFPSLAQGTGVRVSLGAAFVEYLVDPVRHHGALGAGISLVP